MAGMSADALGGIFAEGASLSPATQPPDSGRTETVPDDLALYECPICTAQYTSMAARDSCCLYD